MSKGQNTWKILNVKLPYATFDIGSFEISSNEILIFGGFNEGSLDKVMTFKILTGQAEGDIQVSHTTKLAEKDFFVVNGINVKFTGDQNQYRKEIICTGHNFIHAFDQDLRSFRVLPQIQ